MLNIHQYDALCSALLVIHSFESKLGKARLRFKQLKPDVDYSHFIINVILNPNLDYHSVIEQMQKEDIVLVEEKDVKKENNYKLYRFKLKMLEQENQGLRAELSRQKKNINRVIKNRTLLLISKIQGMSSDLRLKENVVKELVDFIDFLLNEKEDSNKGCLGEIHFARLKDVSVDAPLIDQNDLKNSKILKKGMFFVLYEKQKSIEIDKIVEEYKKERCKDLKQ